MDGVFIESADIDITDNDSFVFLKNHTVSYFRHKLVQTPTAINVGQKKDFNNRPLLPTQPPN